MIAPLLPSCWGLSFAPGCRVSFFGGIQHFPVDGCSATSCCFGVLTKEDECMSFYSAMTQWDSNIYPMNYFKDWGYYAKKKRPEAVSEIYQISIDDNYSNINISNFLYFFKPQSDLSSLFISAIKAFLLISTICSEKGSLFWFLHLKINFKRYLYLFIWLPWVLVVTCGIQFPEKGWNLGPLHWKPGVLFT